MFFLNIKLSRRRKCAVSSSDESEPEIRTIRKKMTPKLKSPNQLSGSTNDNSTTSFKKKEDSKLNKKSVLLVGTEGLNATRYFNQFQRYCIFIRLILSFA